MILFGRGARAGSIVIPASDDTSSPIANKNYAFIGFVIPASFQGTSLTFETSHNGTTFQPLNDSSGAAVNLPVTAGENAEAPLALSAWPHFRVVSDATESAQRTIVVVLKG